MFAGGTLVMDHILSAAGLDYGGPVQSGWDLIINLWRGTQSVSEETRDGFTIASGQSCWSIEKRTNDSTVPQTYSDVNA